MAAVLPPRDIERAVLASILSGVPCGSQAGNDFLVKPTDDLFAGNVFVCSFANDRRYANVRTVLREDHAVANNQAFFGITSEKQLRRFSKKQKRKQKIRDRDDYDTETE